MTLSNVGSFLSLLEGAHVVTEHHLIEQFVPRLTYCLHHVAAAAAAVVLENHAHMGSLISTAGMYIQQCFGIGS